MDLARVWWRHQNGDEGFSGWMPGDRADELADDMGGQGVYERVNIEIAPRGESVE